ncbi:hypothetical protein FM104_06475 [Microbacterium esteraromaticum]|uniref:DUF1023 domain-containing protein n=1 Tax=Microbacterium esteraromaticum TaxID=57043 RepID=A0A1R4JBQ7_9MICO|nr:alpha/beta hydrolase [Microbacterium esteraromaticum]SJN29374.1 hypothetical protein FM104_06475 [Microbacterium esteraromaticum]
MTTIQIPASIGYPERPDGEPASAETLASTLLQGSASIAEFADEADRLSTPTPLWQGEASAAYAAHAQKFAKAHEPMGETLKRVARGVDVFAEQLRELQSEHTTIVGQVTAYDRDRAALMADVAESTETDVPVLQERARRLASQRTGIVDDITGLQERTTDNEDYLVRLFTGADTVAEAQSAAGGIGALALAAISGKPPVTAGPSAMSKWWNGLTETEQNAVIAACPETIGSADGLPASARDRANRTLLESDLAELHQKQADGTLTADETQRLKNAEATQKALKYADGYTVPGTEDQPGGQLWLYDPDAFAGDGRVAISVGDLDTADDVSVSVPGIKTQMDGAPNGVKDAAHLYESARYNGDGSSVATMFWLGYDTPAGDLLEWGEVPSEARAADGGERLATAVDGLRASRADNPAHMTAIGHSYGSTATSYAATNHDLAVDDVALIGSPGTGPAGHASDFSVGADHVYDGRNSRDLVAALGEQGWLRKGQLFGLGLGVDPSSEDFGAHRFEAESTERASHVRNFDDHVRYYDRDSESLYNLGLIVGGNGENVITAEQSYDPWWSGPIDPEADRTPTANEPGRSDTGRGPG